MSRNPEHKFFDTETNTLLADMIRMYEALTGKFMSPAAPERVFVQWATNVILMLLRKANYVGNQNIPSRADDANLDALGELFQNLERPKRKPAISTLRIHITDPYHEPISIRAGTRASVANNLLRWITSADAIIPAGDTYADVPIECMTPGKAGNGVEPGQINILMDPQNVTLFSHCENITVSEGGTEEATDEEYYELMRDSQDSYTTAGCKNAYIYHAKSVSTEIADVVANTPSLLSAEVNLYVLMKDGSPAGEEIKNMVFAACNAAETRPLTDHLVMCDAEQVPYDIDFTYYIPSKAQQNVGEIEAAVDRAVADYISWQSGTLGLDITPDKLHQFLMNTGCVKRVEIRSPEYQVLRDGMSADPNTQPQVAAVGTETVVNGGYEYE